MERLAATSAEAGKVTIGLAELDKAARQLGGIIDPVNGGTRGAPKFPQAALFELLWRAGLRTGEARYFAAVDVTLHHICEGGIYDHLGGGFSRYSVDERWLVPHFEKMLYDNAQLLELLAIAYLRLGKPLYRQRAQRNRHVADARNDDARGRIFALRSMPIPKARRESSTSGHTTR